MITATVDLLRTELAFFYRCIYAVFPYKYKIFNHWISSRWNIVLRPWAVYKKAQTGTLVCIVDICILHYTDSVRVFTLNRSKNTDTCEEVFVLRWTSSRLSCHWSRVSMRNTVWHFKAFVSTMRFTFTGWEEVLTVFCKFLQKKFRDVKYKTRTPSVESPHDTTFKYTRPAPNYTLCNPWIIIFEKSMAML